MKSRHVFAEAAVKLMISVATGAGIGFLVFGGSLLALEIDAFRPDIPPGPLFVALGSGLLAGGGMLFSLFVGPLADRPWFESAHVGWEDSGGKAAALAKSRG